MRVLLISANRLRVPYPVYPLGIDHVAGAITPRHPVQILDLCQVERAEELGKAVASEVETFKPDLVGISLRNVDNVDGLGSVSFTAHYRAVVAAVRQATSAPLLLGGAGYTLFPRHYMETLGADYGLAGEGERLPALLDALEQGEPLPALPGLFVGTKLSAPRAPWHGPMGTRGLLPPHELAFYLERGSMINLQSKRGCPHRCGYCTYPSIEGHGVRPMNPRQVAATARQLQDAGARYLWITDASFNCDEAQNLALARAFRAEHVTVPWGAFFAPAPMSEGYWAELAAAGLTHVEFGTESLSATMLAHYRKPFGVDDVVRAHQQCLDAGLHVAHFFLLGGPGETAQTVDETLAAAEDLRRSVRFFFVGVRIYPDTAMHAQAVREGQITPDQDLLEPLFYQPPGITLAQMESRVEAAAARRFAWMLGSGGEQGQRMLQSMYARGYTGPLWEKLIRAE